MKHAIVAGLVALPLAALASHAARAVPNMPGPSQGLWDEHPGYDCGTSYYVATTGSDAASGTSKATAWATLQHANDTLAKLGPVPNTCVIVAPGTYHSGVNVTAGGNYASATGYLTYRCAVMDQCIIAGDSGAGRGTFSWTVANGPGSYVQVDGFVLAATTATSTGVFGIGIQAWDNEPMAEKDFSVHHLWFLNNIVYGYGQAGINVNDGEYFYTLHNTIYDNANAGCSAQGSGVAYVVLKPIPGTYTPTHDDQRNGVLGPIGNFHNVIAWNVVYDNATTECGTPSDPYDSDGNNIILDTLNNSGLAPAYTYQTLVAFNVAANAGGGGVHVFRSEFATVANNSVYNSGLDPNGANHSTAGIDTNDSYANTVINNLVVARPAPNNQQQSGPGSCAFGVAPYQKFASAILGGGVTGEPVDVFQNNITQLQGGYYSCWGAWGLDKEDPMFAPDNANISFPLAGVGANLKNTYPGWVDVGNENVGTDTVPPSGFNFALLPNSPAIGFGQFQAFLGAASGNAGACPSGVAQCPLLTPAQAAAWSRMLKVKRAAASH